MCEREERALCGERREQLRDALASAFSDRMPLLPLLFSSERIVADPRLSGWQDDPHAPFGAGLERWYFEN